MLKIKNNVMMMTYMFPLSVLRKSLLFFPFLMLMGVFAQPALADGKSVYDKLFKDKAKLKTEKGFVTVHQYDEKIYLEIPKALMGRDFLISSVITNSSELTLAGAEAAPQRFLTIDCTDSLVIFKQLRPTIFYKKDNIELQNALKLSQASAILQTFPIKGYSEDSTALVFDCTSYIDAGSKSVFDLIGRNYGGYFTTIESAEVDRRASFYRDFRMFDSSVAFYSTVTATLTTSMLGLQTTKLPVHTFECASYFQLLPEEKMPIRIYHPEIGSLNVGFDDYRDLSDVKANFMVSRADLQRKNELVYYVDTLLPPSWRDLIGVAIEKWNQAFEQEGLGSPLKVKPFPSDPSFDALDPMNFKIVSHPNPSKGTSYFSVTDPRTGQIMGATITLGQGIHSAIRSNGMIRMSAVDERFRNYYIDDKAVEDVLITYLLKNIGRSLGLTTNLAGSMAYTPEQLRSPEFTQANGISASVMDDVLFNSLARPGDKERGVNLFMNVVGSADRLAIFYLYADIPKGEDETEYLHRKVRSHYGDPAYRFLQLSNPLLQDPRGQFSDLSSDLIQAAYNRIDLLRYVTKNVTSWLSSDEIPANYKETLPAYIFSEAYFNSMIPLLSYIGGVYTDGRATVDGKTQFKSVSRKDQKVAMQTFCKIWDTLDFLNENKELLEYNGGGDSMTKWAVSVGLPIRDVFDRVKAMTVSVAYAEDGDIYTEEEMLKDFEDFLFSDVRKGNPLSDNKLNMINQYITSLITLSPKLKAIFLSSSMNNKRSFVSLSDKEKVSGMKLLCADIMPKTYDIEERRGAAINSVPFYVPNDLTKVGYKMLQSLEKRLKKARSLSNNTTYKSRIDYNLRMISFALGVN